MSDTNGPKPPEPAGKVQIDQISDIKDSTLNIAGRDVIHIDQVVIGDQAGLGLKALERLLEGSPVLKEAVFASRTQLEEIKTEIDRIADYKDVHDLLHQLQYACYNMIRREEPNFPDLAALEILGSYEMNMGTILVRLRAVEARQRIHASELAWIGDIENAQSLLQKAIDFTQPDGAALRKSSWLLMRVINRFPSVINQSLLREAHHLELETLLQTMQGIVPTAEDTSQDLRSVSQFVEGLDAIRELHRRLGALTREHDSWQKLELEFVQLDEMLETDPSFLDFAWKDLIVPLLENLLGEDPDPGMQRIQAARELLSNEIAAQNTPRIKSSLSLLRRETGLQFFQVDVNLKSLCGELRKVAEPLEGILYRISA